jgi:hypothetical protein
MSAEEFVTQTQLLMASQQKQLVEQKQEIENLTTRMNQLLTAQTLPRPSTQPDKPTKPNIFDGTNIGYSHTWIVELENYFRATGLLDDSGRINFAVAQLRGRATDWWDNNTKKLIIHTWDEFKAEFTTAYNPVPVKDTARAKINNMRQTGNVQDYINEFNQWIHFLPHYTEEDKIYFFRNGLKSYLKRQIRFKDPNTLNEAINEAIKVDIEDRQDTTSFVSKKNFTPYSSTQRGKSYPSSSTWNNYNQQNRTSNNHANNGGAVPMELGNIRNDKDVEYKNEEEDKNDLFLFGMSPQRLKEYKEGRCFLCKEKGHLRRDCPKNYKNAREKSNF